MSVAEFQSVYLAEHPFMWLALAVLVGLFVGVRIGRWLERSRTGVAKSAPGPDRSSPDRSNNGPVPDSAESPSAEAEAAVTGALDAADSVDTDSEAVTTDGYTVSDLVGMTKEQAQILNDHGLTTVELLRAATGSKGAREKLADDLQMEDFVVNKWARMAELLSLDGMLPEVAEFMVFAGVNSNKDLASRNAESVAHKLQNLIEKEQRIGATPSRQQLQAWIDQAGAEQH